MNGGQDLGGMQGFGPVIEESDEPNFHADWEARTMAMVVALGASGQWNIDQSRHARETLPPADYLSFSYYRIWLEGVQKLMLDRGMITEDELADGRQRAAPITVSRTLAAEDVHAVLMAGGPADREEKGAPKFSVGDTVRARTINPFDHTRLPRYARGKQGVISAILGFHVFPDSSGNGHGENPQWLYQVRFSATELWGPEANQRDTVTLDLWEPYFEQS